MAAVTITSGCEAGRERLETVAGPPVDPAGKVLLVNYWAEWCKPCREEIPELNRLARESEALQVVGVNYDRLPAATIAEQAEKMGIRFPVLAADPAARWGWERPQVLPTTFIVGGDGRLVETLVGPQTVESLREVLPEGSGKSAKK
ncbi:TlpA family protein disulfide reductase [Microbulbifer halophilus]|uniref:TlpA family protein disulfide reductase n=1 Tax=Microbulbifer halophilus TaxID=453963 RepID=A0ABW5EDX8_9GAMM|nr:TlpA disulfide reductase family protein [Microbulbifer halophilus]MCW8127024.1 TlpA disulfide reductase family protein [Microbulbifer halophilus]